MKTRKKTMAKLTKFINLFRKKCSKCNEYGKYFFPHYDRTCSGCLSEEMQNWVKNKAKKDREEFLKEETRKMRKFAKILTKELKGV